MISYTLRRLWQLVPVVVLASATVFVLMRLVPGDPAQMVAGPEASSQSIAEVRARLGLDQPLPVQYLAWVSHVVRGDLGFSYLSKIPVAELIWDAAPATAQLALVSLLLALVVALPLGLITALKQGSRIQLLVTAYTGLALGVPNFWLGILLILLFTLALGWLPPGGRVDPFQNPMLGMRSLILPALTLSFHMSAVFSRFIATAMLDVLHEDYVRTARAKGLAERVVVIGHALRAALIPVVTVVGLQFGRLLGGTVVVESIFAWPGLGRLMIDAVGQRDYPLVQAVLLIMVMVFVLINLVMDLMYGLIDPRIRLSRGRG
ncbi:MAG: ABC transporter permease [Chloroflexi bacterium]|nr:ABC transporter permease [Chloroflexota bacterium]